MAGYSTCMEPTCGTTVEGKADVCPKCGGPMRRLDESKLRAFILIGTGLFLVVLMGAIWAYIGPQLMRPGVEVDGSTFTGSSSDAQLIMLLFAAVILFGAIGLAYGIYMLTKGQESSAFKTVLLGLVALLVAIGGFIRFGMG